MLSSTPTYIGWMQDLHKGRVKGSYQCPPGGIKGKLVGGPKGKAGGGAKAAAADDDESFVEQGAPATSVVQLQRSEEALPGDEEDADEGEASSPGKAPKDMSDQDLNKIAEGLSKEGQTLFKKAQIQLNAPECSPAFIEEGKVFPERDEYFMVGIEEGKVFPERDEYFMVGIRPSSTRARAFRNETSISW